MEEHEATMVGYRNDIENVRVILDQQREDIRRLLEAAAVIELKFIPYGSCDLPGHNSPDSCWWSTLLAEMKERYDA